MPTHRRFASRRPFPSRPFPSRPSLIAAAALATLAALPLHAQQAAGGPAPAQDTVKTLESVVVRGDIAYRNRTEDTAPTLSYDLEYFQKFEPSTAGDMLKRVPSAVFVSDVLEYDGVQLRGLDPSYTQVLVNGKKVPGAGDDRSFWVDRIPAEMIDHVEILRSNSANRSGDAMAGALNIVLRDAYEFDGSYIRLGAMRYDDGEVQPTVGLVSSGAALGGRILFGLNVQDRYNPKVKRSDRWEEPGGAFKHYEDQTDTRDGRDYSANLSYKSEVGATGRLSLDGFYVQTDRTQTEKSREVNTADDEITDVPGFTDVDQRNWGLGLGYKFDMAGGSTELDLNHARFVDQSRESEEEHLYVASIWDSSEAEATDIDAEDAETSFKIAHKRPLGTQAPVELEFGLDYRLKKRESTYTFLAFEAVAENDPVVYEADGVARSTIRERRIDPYAMLSGKSGHLGWEAGLRFETTKSDIDAEDKDGHGGKDSQSYSVPLPSLHLRWDLGEANRINLSLAESVRRPGFDQLSPVLLEKEYGDNDFIGDPNLKPETAHGLDLGFERRLGLRGVVGVNFFYRAVRDLIELSNTGEEGSEGPDTFVYTVDNSGDGKVWGVEFDLSTPLTVLGLPNTGVFFNYSALDSETEDFMGKRRFNNQAKNVMNAGFIHDLPSVQTSFGASYRKQGEAFSRVVGEEVTTTYDADLEVFVEKRVGKRFSLRLSGTNLLDAEKKEVFHKFNTEQEQKDRDYDEYEIETEKAGPRVQLVGRWAF